MNWNLVSFAGYRGKVPRPQARAALPQKASRWSRPCTSLPTPVRGSRRQGRPSSLTARSFPLLSAAPSCIPSDLESGDATQLGRTFSGISLQVHKDHAFLVKLVAPSLPTRSFLPTLHSARRTYPVVLTYPTLNKRYLLAIFLFKTSASKGRLRLPYLPGRSCLPCTR
ncbi:hypothetical protein K7432_017687, partial [Basidiobolus ranarum]